MGPKNLLILFFSTVAVSLVILIIFFSLFFKNVNLDFNTRLPESAPNIEGAFNQTSTMSPDSKADGLMRSTVNVPPDAREVDSSSKPQGSEPDGEKERDVQENIGDSALPPISDDTLLENEYPQPLPTDKKQPATGEKLPSGDKSLERTAPPKNTSATRTSPSRSTAPTAAPVIVPPPIEEASPSPESSMPPVPQ